MAKQKLRHFWYIEKQNHRLSPKNRFGLCLDDDWDRKRAKIGDYAVVIKEVRNLVHPGRVLVQLPKGRVTKRHSKVTAVTFEAAVDHLEVKVHKSLARRIEEEEERTKAARRSATVPAAAS